MRAARSASPASSSRPMASIGRWRSTSSAANRWAAIGSTGADRKVVAPWRDRGRRNGAAERHAGGEQALDRRRGRQASRADGDRSRASGRAGRPSPRRRRPAAAASPSWPRAHAARRAATGSAAGVELRPGPIAAAMTRTQPLGRLDDLLGDRERPFGARISTISAGVIASAAASIIEPSTSWTTSWTGSGSIRPATMSRSVVGVLDLLGEARDREVVEQVGVVDDDRPARGRASPAPSASGPSSPRRRTTPGSRPCAAATTCRSRSAPRATPHAAREPRRCGRAATCEEDA